MKEILNNTVKITVLNIFISNSWVFKPLLMARACYAKGYVLIYFCNHVGSGKAAQVLAGSCLDSQMPQDKGCVMHTVNSQATHQHVQVVCVCLDVMPVFCCNLLKILQLHRDFSRHVDKRNHPLHAF